MSQSTHKHGRKDADDLLEAEVLAKDYIENGLSSAHEENGLWKNHVDKYMDARTHPICLTVEQADEVIDALRWVDDDWENMDAAERITHKGMRDVYWSILDQYPVDKEVSTSCTCCGFFPLVFENDGSIKDAQEYEVDNDGNKYCFKCFNNSQPFEIGCIVKHKEQQIQGRVIQSTHKDTTIYDEDCPDDDDPNGSLLTFRNYDLIPVLPEPQGDPSY